MKNKKEHIENTMRALHERVKQKNIETQEYIKTMQSCFIQIFLSDSTYDFLVKNNIDLDMDKLPSANETINARELAQAIAELRNASKVMRTKIKEIQILKNQADDNLRDLAKRYHAVQLPAITEWTKEIDNSYTASSLTDVDFLWIMLDSACADFKLNSKTVAFDYKFLTMGGAQY